MNFDGFRRLATRPAVGPENFSFFFLRSGLILAAVVLVGGGALLGERVGSRRRLSGLARGVIIVSLASFTGCSPAPSQNILGSYFPSWMICALAGIGASVVARELLVAAGLDKALPAPLVVYLAMAIAFTFAIWLAWLS